MAVSLGFLGCLIAQGSLQEKAAPAEPLARTTEVLAAASGPSLNTCQSDPLRFNAYGSTTNAPMEIGAPDEFGIAVEDEDSVEMFRFDVHQRTFESDWAVMASKVAPKIARNTRVSISPPLLV